MRSGAWRRAGFRDLAAIELFLRAREARAAGFIGRILREDRLRLPNPLRAGLWIVESEGSVSSALLLSPGRQAFPQFADEEEGAASIDGLRELLDSGMPRPAAVMGPRGYVERLCRAGGLRPLASVDYVLMRRPRLSVSPEPACAGLGCQEAGCELGRAGIDLVDELLPLQEAYEREEVLTPIHTFDPAGCRAALARSLSQQLIIFARRDGGLIGKAGTNARAFSVDQLGGVYVKPEWRRKGVGSLLMAELSARVEAEGREAALFVKPRNEAARRMYTRLGFIEIDEYRADYLES